MRETIDTHRIQAVEIDAFIDQYLDRFNLVVLTGQVQGRVPVLQSDSPNDG